MDLKKRSKKMIEINIFQIEINDDIFLTFVQRKFKRAMLIGAWGSHKII